MEKKWRQTKDDECDDMRKWDGARNHRNIGAEWAKKASV